MMMIIAILIAFLVGGLLTWFVTGVLLKSRREKILLEAEKDTEVMKKNKMLEVKEKFIQLKAELEKQVTFRSAKIQSTEAKLKQRETVFVQRQEELQRKNTEVDAIKENLSAQLVLIEKKQQDLEKSRLREMEQLETISGLSDRKSVV